MPPAESLAPYFVATWIASAILGGIVGSEKNSMAIGFVLGIIFGPLGVIAALALDGRPMCPQCMARLNGQAAVCPCCHVSIAWIVRSGQKVPMTPEQAEDHWQKREQRKIERETRAESDSQQMYEDAQRAVRAMERNPPPLPPVMPIAPPLPPGSNPNPPPRRNSQGG